jgi:exodeoxyribonuclease V beta subunit
VTSREEPAADAAPSETAPETLTIFDFPRGAKAGTCLHAVFEEIDYRGADSAATEALVEEKLTLHGFERSWTTPVRECVDKVLRAPLEGADGWFTLAELSAADRNHEMEFYLPMGRVTARGLASAFTASAGSDLPEELPRLLERLEFKPTRGFLKGFIDLVFHWAGRYYLLDWKSNFLGDKVADYGPPALRRAMTEHLYQLQYHLYTVALHRYLAQRLESYEYERHFGGVFYLFLRGVDPSAGPDWGVYRARPPRSTVEMLDRYLSEGTPPGTSNQKFVWD